MPMIKKTFLSLIALSSTLNFPNAVNAQGQIARPPQMILISFDGSYTNEMWKATREHGLNNNARYTHFISGVDFLIGSSKGPVPGETKQIYTPPKATGLCSAHNPKCKSDIGFGGTKALLNERIAQVTESMEAGMEIASHANAHFDGTTWNTAEWTYEFNWFHKLLLEVFSINKITSGGRIPNENAWQEMLFGQMRGIRAPYLGRGEGLWQTMAKQDWQMLGRNVKHRYSYDASQVSHELSAWPTKSRHGFWNFPLVTIPVPGRAKTILSMDYNFYVAQSNIKDDLVNAPKYEEQMYQAYINWFTRNYHGNRAPLNIGHHFSTWNGGAYWRALQRFVKSVCSQPEVACVTYNEAVEFIEAQGLEKNLAVLNAGQFNQSNRPRVQIPLLGKVANSAFEGEIKQLVSQNRFAKIPAQDFQLMVGEKVLEQNADLVSLAKQGVSYVQLKNISSGSKTDLFIDWNPHTDSARLRLLQQDEQRACPAGSHDENVDPSLINLNKAPEII